MLYIPFIGDKLSEAKVSEILEMIRMTEDKIDIYQLKIKKAKKLLKILENSLE